MPKMFEEEPEPLNEDDPDVAEDLFETLYGMNTRPENLADPMEQKRYSDWLAKQNRAAAPEIDRIPQQERPTRRWHGILDTKNLEKSDVALMGQLTAILKMEDWAALSSTLDASPDAVNHLLQKGAVWQPLLHGLVRLNAPPLLVREVVQRGAFLTALDSTGKTAFELATGQGDRRLAEIVTPATVEAIGRSHLAASQELFHGLIRAVMLGYNVRLPLRLPQLSVFTETPGMALWFPVPGMGGGFHFWLESENGKAYIIAESWSRMVGGSGMRHRVTPFEVVLLEEGIV